MAIEPIRGCGYRKVGGIYMVGDKPTLPCSRLPAPLHVCPTCGQGIKQSRGFTWVESQKLLEGILPDCMNGDDDCSRCPLSDVKRIGEHAGLLWVGESFYPTPRHFLEEAKRHGISKRLSTVPRGFEIGKHWILLAHPAVYPGEERMLPGIFSMFKPKALEIIVTETEGRDEKLMARYRARGLTPVEVPDDDPDHADAKRSGATQNA